MVRTRGGPASRKSPSADAYARKKARERSRQSAIARAGNDIAATFPKRRRHATRRKLAGSLLAFCQSAMREKFGLSFSPDHLTAIDQMETAILHGGNFALAMPRGSGKTTLVIACVLWALLNGHKRYLALIGADKRAASKLLSGIKVELETNDTLLELYPEAIYPIRCLERIANRCKGQNYGGAATYIEWTAEKIVFATIPGADISGAVIEVCGIMGGVRGMQHTRPDGEPIRPDVFVVDDPQTNKSALSTTMVEQRLELITATLPGLAGPGKEIAGFCLCTVIEADDVADQLLNRELYPDWRGQRFKMVYEWPGNSDLWDDYASVYRESMAAGLGLDRCNEYYSKHRDAMDAGAVVAWPERKTPRELSALQHAYNLRLRMGAAFFKECQNEPLDQADGDDLLPVEHIQRKTNGYRRGVVSRDADLLTAFVDVQDRLLYWLVLATRTTDFSTWVVDYGAWPEQRSSYFSLSSVTRTLAKRYAGAGREGRIRSGLLELVDHLVGRLWMMPDGTTALPLSRIGIDAAWESRVVQAVALESPHAARLLPRFGRGVAADDVPFEMWKPKPGERRGVGWKIRPAEGGGRYALLDTNYWKNFTHARLAVGTGDRGALSLFQPEGLATHRMLAEHLRAEARVETKTGERTVQIWKEKPNKPDNHFFDCLVGAVAMAAIEGASLSELRLTNAPTRRRRVRRVMKL